MFVDPAVLLRHSPVHFRFVHAFSAAAALVNVTIKRRSMSTGWSLSVMIFMIRSTSTAVLPEPAAAETNIFLSLSSMTFRWSSVHVIPMFCSVSDVFIFLHLSHHIYSPSGIFSRLSNLFPDMCKDLLTAVKLFQTADRKIPACVHQIRRSCDMDSNRSRSCLLTGKAFTATFPAKISFPTCSIFFRT